MHQSLFFSHVVRRAIRAGAIAAALLAGVVGASAANAQVTFKSQVQPNKTSKTTTEARVAQVLSIAGMDLETGSEQTSVMVNETGPRAADGSIIGRSKMESLKASMSLPGGVMVQFDSANPDAGGDAGPYAVLVDLLKAVAGIQTETKFDKQGRTLEVKVNSTAGGNLNADARKALEGRLNPQTLKDEANEALDRLPKGPVKPGDKWEVTNKVRLEGGQTMSFQEEHVFKGEETANGKKTYRVDVTPKSVTYAIDAGGGLPLSLKSSDLKVTEGTGHYLFDPQEGAITSTAGKTRIQGDLVFVAGGQELPGKLDLTIETTVRTE